MTPGTLAAARRGTAGSTTGLGCRVTPAGTEGAGAATAGGAGWGVGGVTPGVANASGGGPGGATRTGAINPIKGSKMMMMIGRRGLGPGDGPGGGGSGEKATIPWLKGIEPIRTPPRPAGMSLVVISRKRALHLSAVHDGPAWIRTVVAGTARSGAKSVPCVAN